LHLKVEMQLDLKSVEYIVFDEADRLFEMGFAEQLNEIIGSLPTSRQTLLFSATLPKSLVEFAKAGLHDPVLVRLDAETKVSEQLEMAFLAVKDGEREAALCYTLDQIIKMPLASEEQKHYLQSCEQKPVSDDDNEDNNDGDNGGRKKKKTTKRERLPPAHELPTPESTIVFVATKHDVEYIHNLLRIIGYAVSYIYGTLDQTARKEQLYRFRGGKTSILVVTDVAARGIDIPVLANVINYSLPSSPKVFVHRVGRTARAGRRGWAYSLVRESEVPYLLDLELFLGRKLVTTRSWPQGKEVNYTECMVVGSLPREGVEFHQEEVDAILKRDYDLSSMKTVATRGEKLYLKTREPASHESVKRAKQVISSGWDDRHLLLGPSMEKERQNLLERLANRRVKETVFEFKKTTFGAAAELMARRRRQIAPIQRRAKEKQLVQQKEREGGLLHTVDEELERIKGSDADMAAASEADLQATFGESNKKRKYATYRDPNFFISHYASAEAVQERGYSLGGKTGSNFAHAARGATFDFDGEGKEFQTKQNIKWDKKKGKYVRNDGSEKSVKYIRGEGGQKIPASFRSGRFDNWKAAHKTGDIKVGSMETSNGSRSGEGFNKFKHTKIKAPKMADRARDDYESRKKRVQQAVDKGISVKGFSGKTSGGLQTVDQVRKQRQLKESRRDKNARPSKKQKR
jgi:ATP-dependent RNA helicase DDX54/DBP10